MGRRWIKSFRAGRRWILKGAKWFKQGHYLRSDGKRRKYGGEETQNKEKRVHYPGFEPGTFPLA
jgi:hypothetical protein